MKRIILAALLLFATCGVSLATVDAPGGTFVDPVPPQTIGKSIRVELCDITYRNANLSMVCNVVTSKDMNLTVTKNGSSVYDDLGNELKSRSFNLIGIGNVLDTEGTMRRQIKAGIPTPVVIEFWADVNYPFGCTFKNITLTMNGKRVVFENVTPLPPQLPSCTL